MIIIIHLIIITDWLGEAAPPSTAEIPTSALIPSLHNLAHDGRGRLLQRGADHLPARGLLYTSLDRVHLRLLAFVVASGGEQAKQQFVTAWTLGDDSCGLKSRRRPMSCDESK